MDKEKSMELKAQAAIAASNIMVALAEAGSSNYITEDLALIKTKRIADTLYKWIQE